MLTVKNNSMLHYALNDNVRLSAKTKEIIESKTCWILLLAQAEIGFFGLVPEVKLAKSVAHVKNLMQQ